MRWPRTAVLSLALVGVLAAPVAASQLGSFRDVDTDSSHADAIAWLSENGISSGCAPDLFCGRANVSRAQLATFLQRLAESGVIDAATLDGFTADQLAGQDGRDGHDGPAGAPGADGAPGVDGNTILGMDGAPDPALGNVGDLYLDTAAIELYGPKTADGWGLAVPLLGADGADGADGTNGTDGVDGQDGTAWHTGVGAPDDSLGVDGDFYLDTTAHAYYGPKVGGAWDGAVSLIGPAGTSGLDGQDGQDGQDGASWLAGAGAPDVSAGGDGDFYLDTAAHAYYGPKTAGVWGAAVSLVGPKGDKGDTGEKGDPGDGGAVTTARYDATVTMDALYASTADIRTVTATCPNVGDVVLGGGFDLNGGSDDGTYVNVHDSFPTSTGWRVAAWIDQPGGLGATVTAHVICMATTP